MLSKLIKITGTRQATVLSILFAIVNRVIYVFLNANLGKDKMLQLTASENILAGRGYGVQKYFTDNLTTPVIDRMIEFPPGYSVSMLPFILFSDHNLWAATIFFELIVAIVFLFVLRSICFKIGYTTSTTNLCTVVFGCFQYEFFFLSPPSDAVALLLILLSLNVLLRIFKKSESQGKQSLLLISILFFSPSFFRFAYIPVSLALPAIIAVSGHFTSKANLKRVGLRLFVITTLLIFGLLLYEKINSGFMMPEYPGSSRGFFPGNVLHIYPFIPASFINLDFLAQQFDRFLAIPYTTAMDFFKLINLLLIPFTVYVFYLQTKRYPGAERNIEAAVFFRAVSVISVVIILMLIYASLTISFKKYNLPSHLEVARMFALIFVFLQLLFFSRSSFRMSVRKTLIEKIIIFSFGLLLAIETLHGIYFNVKATINFSEMREKQHYDQDYRYFDSLCNELKVRHPDKELLVASTNRYFCNKAMLNGDKGIFDIEALNNKKITVSKGSVLLIIIPRNDYWIMKDFLTIAKPELIKNIVETEFYVQYLFPQ